MAQLVKHLPRIPEVVSSDLYNVHSQKPDVVAQACNTSDPEIGGGDRGISVSSWAS